MFRIGLGMKIIEHEVLAYIIAHAFATTEEISERFDVATMTVRRCLAKLEEKNQILRVRSGAVPVSIQTSLSRHLYLNRDEKKKIVAYAVSLCEKANSIFLDSGSTCYLLADLIPDEMELTVITHSLDIAATLRRKNGIRVITPGGEIDKKINMMVGTHCEESLSKFCPDIAFLGAGKVDISYGTHERELVQIPIKRIMNNNARTSYLLLDSTKFGETSNFRCVPLADIKNIITTDKINPVDLEMFKSKGIGFIVLDSKNNFSRDSNI